MTDDDFFHLQENDQNALFDLNEELSDAPLFLQDYHFTMPTQLFEDLQEAEVTYGLMMHASEKLSFAYQDLIRKIEVIS